MRLGLGLYRHMLTADNFRFARQAGATDIVAHLTDYFKTPRIPSALERNDGWGDAGDPGRLWTYSDLRTLRESVEAEGLTLAALENFDPAHWHDILLDGPLRDRHVAAVREMIRDMGRAGIRVMGYNFSLAGVWGHVEGPWARGGAMTVAFLGSKGPAETDVPPGMVWNMVYDRAAMESSTGASVARQTTPEQIWDRLRRFLEDVLPVAEEAGVRLALHPDDPPMPALRGTPRLVYQPSHYQKLLGLNESPANGLEFCIGSLAEMTEGDIYDEIERFARTGRICYVHFRNVRGKVPEYYEVFVDEGDIDMLKALRSLRDNGYDGLLIPDHTPLMTCAAPWHAGMAYALGYMRAALKVLEEEDGCV